MLAGCVAAPGREAGSINANAPAQSATAEAKASPPQGTICKREKIMGSHTPRRVCRTAAEEAAERERAARLADKINRSRPDGVAPGT